MGCKEIKGSGLLFQVEGRSFVGWALHFSLSLRSLSFCPVKLTFRPRQLNLHGGAARGSEPSDGPDDGLSSARALRGVGRCSSRGRAPAPFAIADPTPGSQFLFGQERVLAGAAKSCSVVTGCSELASPPASGANLPLSQGRPGGAAHQPRLLQSNTWQLVLKESMNMGFK